MILTQATGNGNIPIYNNINIVQSALDIDVLKFLNVIGTTPNSVQLNALNNLVIDLKRHGFWTRFDVIYPMFGGTAVSNSYNLIDVTKFRLGFVNTWTHTISGSQSTGINAYATTDYIPLNEMSASTTSNIGYYSRTTNAVNARANMGAVNGSATVSDSSLQIIRTGAGSYGTTVNGRNATDFAGTAIANGPQYTLGNKSATNSSQTYINGLLTATASPNNTYTSRQIYLNNRNQATPNVGSGQQCAFAHLGRGSFNSSEALALYTIIQTYQIALNRQV